MMLPKLVAMAEELRGRCHIVKFNCNKYNKELGQSLGVKVAPTFHLYKDDKQVAVMTGLCHSFDWVPPACMTPIPDNACLSWVA